MRVYNGAGCTEWEFTCATFQCDAYVIYEAGDESVGLPGGWLVRVDCKPDAKKHASDMAIRIAMGDSEAIAEDAEMIFRQCERHGWFPVMDFHDSVIDRCIDMGLKIRDGNFYYY